MNNGDKKMKGEEKDNPYMNVPGGYSDPVLRILDKFSLLTATVFLLSFTVFLMLGFMVWQGFYFIPETHIVEVDEMDRVFYAGKTSSMPEKDIDKYTPQQISSLVDAWRTVTPDNVKKKTEIRNLLCMVSDSSDAKRRISEYINAKEDNPFKLGETLTRSVQIKAVLKSGDSTWTADWVETTRKHNGEMVGEEKYYKANIITERRNVDEECRQVNPFGISALTLSWSVVK